MDLLNTVGLAEGVFDLGLRGRIDAATQPDLADAVLTARRALRKRLETPPLSDLVEPFDPEKYNHNATLAENLLFGTAVDETFAIENLSSNNYLLLILKETGLDAVLTDMGHRIAQTVTELFSGLPEDHPFFEQLSFMSAEEIPEYQKVVSRTAGVPFESIREEDVRMLLRLPFAYIEPRHRLGLMTDELEVKLLQARARFEDELPETLRGAIEFYEPEEYNSASSLQDNVLLGRIAYGIADGPEQVGEAIRSVLEDNDLRDPVFEVGLDFNVGSGGKRLSLLQRQKITLARALLKRPDLLIINRAFASLDARSQENLVARVLDMAKGGGGGDAFGVFWVLQNPGFADKFDETLVFEDGTRVKDEDGSHLAYLVEQS